MSMTPEDPTAGLDYLATHHAAKALHSRRWHDGPDCTDPSDCGATVDDVRDAAAALHAYADHQARIPPPATLRGLQPVATIASRRRISTEVLDILIADGYPALTATRCEDLADRIADTLTGGPR